MARSPGVFFSRRLALALGLLTIMALLALRLYFRHALLETEALLMLSAAVLALALARVSLKPLYDITCVAQDLAHGHGEARVRPIPSGDWGTLAEALNLLADRIENDFLRLRRLDEMRKDFVANVSHEMRTPLSAIKAFAETLSSGAIDDREHGLEFAGEIEKNADRMSQLVDDLLELSALESGNLPPALESVSLMRLASEVVASLMPLAQKKEIVLRLEPFHDIPDVQADRNQMKQVLTNLIDNAIKFTQDKGVIRVSASAQGSRVIISIEDTGRGIPEADLPRIFERFYRVDKARSREMGGTGLGLSIVKHIVEAHGGSVWGESRNGEGAIFRFTLPAA